MKITIKEAIKAVMRQKGNPMTASEIYKQISERNLYQFKAADPINVVNNQIRRYCKGIPEKKSYSKTKHFEFFEPNKYYFLDPPELISEKGESYKEYLLPKISSTNPISSEDIINGSREYQITVLREWFLLGYEVAIKDSQGGYIYLLDGPYEAIDVLNDEFSNVLALDIISEAAQIIEDTFNCKEWSKIPNDRDIEEFFIENLNTEFYKNFENTARTIKMLSTQSNMLKDDIQQPFNRMLYASIITALESYLSDAFISTVRSDKANVRKLVEETPELRDRSLKLGEIYKRQDSLPDEVDNYLLGLVYHRLDKVEQLYLHTLGISFPPLSKPNLFRAVTKRHVIVHRNGKEQDGGLLAIEIKDIHFLLKEVTSFIKEVDKQLKAKQLEKLKGR